MSFISLGGRYSGVLTKTLNNGTTAFYIKYRDINSKSVRKKVGESPDMTKSDARERLAEIKKEIKAQKELEQNPNSPIPKILLKKSDKQVYTLNDLADFYFYDNKTKSSREMQNKYNYHFSQELFATKNIHLITEDDISDFLDKKGAQRADSRRSNSNNITKLHKEGSLPKRKRKPKAKNLTLIEREQEEFDQNQLNIEKLEKIVELNSEDWRSANKAKYLKEKNKILKYRLCPETAKLLLKDKTLTIDKLNSLRGILSRKSIKELLLLASTIVTYANRHKKLNILNKFNIQKGDKFYIKVDNVKPRYLTKEEIHNYLREVKHIAHIEPKTHGYIYLISLLALSTAARRDTILNIKIEDIDLANNHIELRNFKTEKSFTSTISNKEIKEEIIRRIGTKVHSSFLFENKLTGFSLTAFPPKMKEILNYTVNCNRSYLNWLTIKEFRNTVASHLAMSGVSIMHIAQILNHASTRTTEIYAQLAPTTAKEDLANLVGTFLEDTDS